MPETLNNSNQTRPEANKMAIYKHSRGFELGTSQFQVQRSNYNRSVTLPASYILSGVLVLNLPCFILSFSFFKEALGRPL